MAKLSAKLLLSLFVFLISATAFAQQNMKQYRDLLTKHEAALGITANELNEATITNAYTDEQTGLTYIYLQQTYKAVKVYNSIISVALKNGKLAYTSGKFVKSIAEKTGTEIPALSVADAVKAAAQHLSLTTDASIKIVKDDFATDKIITAGPSGIARKNIPVQLFWTLSHNTGAVSLSWNVNIDMLSTADWWNVRIDALTGKYLEKDNWTVNEEKTFDDKALQLTTDNGPRTTDNRPLTAPALLSTVNRQLSTGEAPPTVTTATYKVIPYPAESPNFGSPTNVTDPWLAAGAANNAVTNGWHFDGTTNYNITRGNNVFAFLDVTNSNTANVSTNWPDTSTTAIPSLTFVNTPIFAAQPSSSPNEVNKKFALDNLFYWNNIIHDIFYQYGFTEAAGNFQTTNFGRGGFGNDYVEANAQDGGGRNNANFGTPGDGGNPRMQMYLWNGPGQFTVNTPAAIAGQKTATEGSLVTTVPTRLSVVGAITNTVVLYNDNAGGTIHRGCAPATNAAAIAGHIAMIDAFGGSAPCTTYAYKVKSAQNAGAIAVIVYSNGINPVNIGGNDAVANSVTIPVISINNADGLAIINQITLGNTVTVTLGATLDLDGDIDNGIVAHEYGHGISTRLTGGAANPSCLGNAEEGGEGWSDYFALMVTTNWATANLTDGPLARPLATYAVNQTATGVGLRRYPYSTNLAVNPLTYADMTPSPEVHAIGEIWCAALWDMTWNIIQQQGSITPDFYNSAGNGGNTIALNLVMTALKMQPCSPGFIDARNAILAADSVLYNNAHRCAIWNAFARRGMGASASQGSSQSATDQTAATDLPVRLNIAKLPPQTGVANNTTTITHTITCDCSPLNNYVVRDSIPAGFSYVSSSPSGTLAGNILSFPSDNFTAQQTKIYSITLKNPVTGCSIDTVINDNRETATLGGFVSSGTNTWATNTTMASSGTSSWQATDLSTVSAAYLTSAATSASALKPMSIFSFKHFFSTESKYDGGVVEYSTNGFTWTDAGSLFFPNTYNNNLLGGTGLGTQRVFSGSNFAFTPAYLNVSGFGTTPVQFRFRLETDDGVGSQGWFIDDIQRVNGCGGFLKTSILNGSSILQDTTLTPVFVVQAVVALNDLSFNAQLKSGRTLLDWHTTAEQQLQNYTVQWSTDNNNWKTIGTVNAQNGNNNNYNLIHAYPAKGNNFYRLKRIELNGSFNYSVIRIVNVKDENNAPFILPNPAGETATLYLPRNATATTVKIYNSTGALVAELKAGAGIEQLNIPTAKYPAGIYMVIINGAERTVSRLVVQH